MYAKNASKVCRTPWCWIAKKPEVVRLKRSTVTHLCPPQLQKNALVQGTKVLVRKTPTHSSTTSANVFVFVGQRRAWWSWRGICQAALIMIRVLVNREGKVSTCTIQPSDSVCPDYCVKTSKNEFFKVSEGRLCYWALYFCLATVCTDFLFNVL